MTSGLPVAQIVRKQGRLELCLVFLFLASACDAERYSFYAPTGVILPELKVGVNCCSGTTADFRCGERGLEF